MPRRNVNLIPDHFYHIYNRAVADNLLFVEERNYSFFLNKIKIYLLNSAEILAYCLMPNHYHLLIQLKTEELPRAMQRLAMSYTISFNNVYKRKGHLFQGRYQLKYVPEYIYLEHLSRYIHLNPIAAGLVSRLEEWKYSSYCEYVGLREPDFINRKVILSRFGFDNVSLLEQNYRDFVEDWIYW
jgi:REP element-mobilizing transposase RayT